LDNSAANPYPAGSLTVTVNLVPPQLTIGGADSVDEGTLYQLALRAFDANGQPITGWTIHWGDGTVQTVAGSPSQATHFYTFGGQHHHRQRRLYRPRQPHLRRRTLPCVCHREP